ncbi:MAG: phosphopantetheine-binding protein [Verrucomicrobium sp.]|nr:phosphopantetheine-binding protein [Verrucomicrobium sp.]
MIISGIIERYLPAESKVSMAETTNDTRLAEDLGIDSLTMLEIVLSIEEALGFRIEDSELRNIRTMGDVHQFLDTKLSGAPEDGPAAAPAARKYLRDEIASIIPQQPPFLFVDEASLTTEAITASYFLKGDEQFFDGHFKDDPVVPAAIVFEALGQACCLWVLEQGAAQAQIEIPSNQVVFASLDGAHFYKRAKPGERLEFEAKLLRLRSPLALFEGTVKVGGVRIAHIEKLVLAFGDIENLERNQIAAHADPAPAAA